MYHSVPHRGRGVDSEHFKTEMSHPDQCLSSLDISKLKVDVVIIDENGAELWDHSKWKCVHFPQCLPTVRLVDLREHDSCLDNTDVLDFDDFMNVF